MKKLVLFFSLLAVVLSGNAQFSRARLQATGLTCAMCSNAIHKALLKIPFVETVNADIRNSAFDIVFKKGWDVEIDELRKAVEDAGFFIGGLNITGNFNDLKIADDQKVKLGKNHLRFLDVGKQTLNGEKTIRLLNKEFVTAKEFKKFNNTTKARIQQGEKDGEMIFLVTI